MRDPVILRLIHPSSIFSKWPCRISRAIREIYRLLIPSKVPNHGIPNPSSVFSGLAIVSILMAALPALAWPPTYGAEFEFTNDVIAAGKSEKGLKGHEHEAALAFANAVKAKCKTRGCVVFPSNVKFDKNEFRVEFTEGPYNGFWFQISYDPRVVEITTKPSSLDELRTLEVALDEMIFATATEVGLKVDPTKRAGHFNYGVISTYRNDARLFLRHFADFQNRPELSLGILRKSLINAPPLSVLDESQRRGLSDLIYDLDGPLRTERLATIPQVAQRIESEVYTRAYFPDWKSNHYQAMGLKYVAQMMRFDRDRPAENRAVRSQRNMRDFILLAELHEARTEYLKKQGASPIIYNATERTEFSEQELASRFYIYVAECGLAWDRLKTLLPENLLEAGIDPFVRGEHDWNSKDYVTALRSHLELVADSSWVRERLTEAFSSVPASATDKASAVLAELEVMSREGRYSSDAKLSFRSFHDKVLAAHPALEASALIKQNASTRYSLELCRAAFTVP